MALSIKWLLARQMSLSIHTRCALKLRSRTAKIHGSVRPCRRLWSNVLAWGFRGMFLQFLGRIFSMFTWGVGDWRSVNSFFVYACSLRTYGIPMLHVRWHPLSPNCTFLGASNSFWSLSSFIWAMMTVSKFFRFWPTAAFRLFWFLCQCLLITWPPNNYGLSTFRHKINSCWSNVQWRWNNVALANCSAIYD